MAFPPQKQITSWSFTRYQTYKQCPYRAKLLYLEKRQEPKGEPLERGTRIHKQAELFVKGAPPARVPTDLARFADEFKRMRARMRKDPSAFVVEDTWAYRKDWSTTTWDDWRGCWLRVKIDVAERDGPLVALTDFKTGKYRPENAADYLEQQELYATTTLTRFQNIPDLRVTARLLYTDAGIVHPPEPVEYALKDLPALRKDWERKTRPMLSDTRFAPRPNNLCRFCHFRKDNGGPCKF